MYFRRCIHFGESLLNDTREIMESGHCFGVKFSQGRNRIVSCRQAENRLRNRATFSQRNGDSFENLYSYGCDPAIGIAYACN